MTEERTPTSVLTQLLETLPEDKVRKIAIQQEVVLQAAYEECIRLLADNQKLTWEMNEWRRLYETLAEEGES